MNSTFRRLVGVSAAAVVIAGSALVAAPTIECKGGETLTLKPGYRYETTIPAFEGSFGTGYFATLKFPGAKAKTIVFDSDDAKDDPRAYQMKLIGMSSGTANKMVIFLAVGSGPVIKMIFRRLGK